MKKLFTSMMIFSTSLCFTTIQVEVNDLNTNQQTYKVEIKLSSFQDLKQPFQVVYNGYDKFYNNHNERNELLPVYLYTQETAMRDITSKLEPNQFIVYASTTELKFFPSLGTSRYDTNPTRPLSKTPPWSKLWSRDTSPVGVPSEVNVTYSYDSTAKKITFYFPSIYAESFPPKKPNILSTYTEYLQME